MRPGPGPWGEPVKDLPPGLRRAETGLVLAGREEATPAPNPVNLTGPQSPTCEDGQGCRIRQPATCQELQAHPVLLSHLPMTPAGKARRRSPGQPVVP